MLQGMTDNRNHLVAAGLIALAEGIMAGVHPVPDSVSLWQHGLTAQQLLTLADTHDVKINVILTDDGKPAQASVRITVGVPGTNITWYAITKDVTPERIAFYEAHNTECAVV
jgi:hypothetical protein